MKALRYVPGCPDFVLEDVPEPKIEADDDVIIEVKYAGLCGTDLHVVQVFANVLRCGKKNHEMSEW